MIEMYITKTMTVKLGRIRQQVLITVIQENTVEATIIQEDTMKATTMPTMRFIIISITSKLRNCYHETLCNMSNDHLSFTIKHFCGYFIL